MCFLQWVDWKAWITELAFSVRIDCLLCIMKFYYAVCVNFMHFCNALIFIFIFCNFSVSGLTNLNHTTVKVNWLRPVWNILMISCCGLVRFLKENSVMAVSDKDVKKYSDLVDKVGSVVGGYGWAHVLLHFKAIAQCKFVVQLALTNNEHLWLIVTIC